MPNQKIGFIGLGNMGREMAANLLKKGYELVVRDQNSETVEQFVSQLGGRAAKADADFSEVDILILMLPSGPIVKSVLSDSNGITSALKPGAFIVDMSSSAPDIYPALAEVLSQRDLHLIDAPVSGNVSGAAAGTLSIMAGGDSAAIDKTEPVLLAIGQRVFRTGTLGTGQIMKALNNLLSAGGLMLAAEVLLIGKRNGLDPKLMTEILNVSTGRNNSTERKIEPFVLSGAYNSGFGLQLMAKDLRTARDVAQASDITAPLSELSVKMAENAADELGASADHTEVARWLESQLGERF